MTKISTYVVDEKVTALDKWIGSDANMQNRTKNFTPKKLAAYFNEDQVINIGTPLQYKYYTLDPLEARPNGTLTFETEIGPTVNFSSITTFLLSKYTTKQNIVSDFLNFLDGSKVLLFKSSDINSFGFYRISSLEPYEPDPNFFVVTVAYETGNGALEEDEDYMISLVSLAGEFIPTKTSELINDGDDGVNPFISELDIDRTEWDAAYEGKINSAEVTGDTTKTLTLTKQDGSTIEASWTDKGLDLELTTTGTSGVATLVGSVLNIPDYTIDTSEFVHIEGDEFIYNTKKFYQTDSIVSQLEFNNTRSIDGLASIEMVNTDGASSIDVINSGAGEGVNILNSGEGYGQIITNQDTGFGLLVNNDGSGTSGIGGGIKIIGTSYAPSFTISNSAQGDAIFVNSIGISAGTPINLQQDGVTNFQVSKLGDVTANKLIKSGGTSGQYLMADGSVSTGPSLTGYVPYTGATGDVDLGAHQLKADSIAVSTTSTETVDVGEIVWNAVDGTFDMGLIGGVTLQAGQELHMYGKATEVISNGQAVMFAGVQGDHILIAKADAATINANPEYLIGVATQDFTNNQFGYVTVFGNVRGLNTTGYTLGSVLYYNSQSATDGLLTATMPTAPNAKIIVAAVVRVHATQGILLVRPHVMPKLKDIQDVYAPSPSSNNGLFWNSSTLRYENNSIIGALGYTPYNATNPSNYITLGSISSTATGLTYTNTTGVFSLTSGYVIPTTTEESNWNDAYSNRITSASTPLSISSNAISISQAGSTTNGYLTSSDWNIFNSKQVAGNYITSLTGEATASGPGAASVTLNNASVTTKILSGVNITGGTILDTDTMLTAFGKLQNQINSLIGGSIYQGVWNANTNTPTLTSSVGTDGNYYIVNVAGSTNLNGITDWKIGDWAIFHGGTWQKVDNTDAVSSVNGFTGAVSLTTSNIPEGPTNFYYTDARVSANTDVAANTASRHNPVYIGITGNLNGLSIDGLQNLTLVSASSTQNGALTSTDWSVFNNKQPALNGTGFVKISGTTISYDNSTYALDSEVVKLTGVQSITGSKSFTTNTAAPAVVITNNSTDNGILLQNTSTGSALRINNGALSTGDLIRAGKDGNVTFIVNQNGNATAASFIKSGGTSAQYLKADGSVSTLTNPITGSLTTNYLPKATGATTLGNSLIYDNGTNIEIGGGIITNKSGGTFWQSKNGATNYFVIGNDSTISGGSVSDINYYTYSGNQIFSTAGSERLRITSGGNVGIGTTSPSAKLDLFGAIRFTRTDDTAQYSTIQSNSNGSFVATSYRPYAGAGNYGDYRFNAMDSTGATITPLYINTNGNVGIGTTSPSNKLEVSTSGTALASFIGAEYSQFNIIGGSQNFYIQNYNSVSIIGTKGASPLLFTTNETERLRITSNGNVGIGTTSPSGALHVATFGQYSYFSGNSGGTAIADVQGLSIGWNKSSGAGETIIAYNKGGGSTGGLAFSNNDGGVYNERMRITSGGNVGIGTTSPSYQLQLSTDSAAKPTSALWTIASDERIKENINSYTKGLNELLKINPITYDYNGLGGFKKGKGGVGIIAQEIAEILPDSVSSIKGKLNETDEEEIDILNFNGHELTYILINAVKELKAEIEILKNK